MRIKLDEIKDPMRKKTTRLYQTTRRPWKKVQTFLNLCTLALSNFKPILTLNVINMFDIRNLNYNQCTIKTFAHYVPKDIPHFVAIKRENKYM